MENTERLEMAKAGPVAEFLQTTEGNLARLRFEGRGPAYARIGRSIRYRWSDVYSWVESNIVSGGAQ
jgi:hypothetical protein